MALELSDRTWHGRTVREGEVSINDLWRHLPYFTSEAFRLGDGENEYLDLISRTPIADLGNTANPKDRMSIPVAAVSKQQYALVQHSEVLRNVLQALEQNSINL